MRLLTYKVGANILPGVNALDEKNGKVYEITWILDHPEELDGSSWVDDWGNADFAELLGEVDAVE